METQHTGARVGIEANEQDGKGKEVVSAQPSFATVLAGGAEYTQQKQNLHEREGTRNRMKASVP